MTVFSFFLRYPWTFIETEFRKFFGEQLHPASVVSFIHTEEQFLLMHDKLLSSLFSDRSPMISDTVMMDFMIQPSTALEESTTTTSETTQNEKMAKLKNTLFIHYSYEKRFQSMKRGLHVVHEGLFSQSANGNVKMIVGTRNRRSAYHELIRKRPPPFLLKDTERPSNEYFFLFLNDTYSVFSYSTRETEEKSSGIQQACV